MPLNRIAKDTLTLITVLNLLSLRIDIKELHVEENTNFSDKCIHESR